MDLFEFSRILSDTTPYLLLVCLTIVFFRYRRIEVHYKVLAFYLILALIANVAMEIMGTVFKNNLVLIPLFGLFELALFTILYSTFMRMERFVGIIIGLGVIGCSYILYECLTIDFSNTTNFQTYSRVLDSFIVIIYSMVYFFEKLSKGTDLNDSTLSLNTIILVFFSLNVILLLPINFLINEGSYLKFYFWLTFAVVLSIFYLIITYSIWKNGKTPKHLRSGSE